jgi:hypothetical protein
VHASTADGSVWVLSGLQSLKFWPRPSPWVVWQPVPQQPGVAHSQPSVSGAVAWLQSEAPALQVYEHDVPLQLAADAFVRVHLSPHALQLLVVFSSVHVVPPHSVSRHVHAPLLQSGLGCVHVVWLTQLPAPPHVCVVLPLQLVWAGAHTPWHAPDTHVWLVQAAGGPHVPLAVQTSTELPEQVDCPGAHMPVHAPPMHVWFVHAAGAPHVPLAPQVCTPLPEHCTAPGEHVPWHAPDTQAELVQVTALPHVPLAVHVWTPLPWHRVCPGPHTPAHAPPMQVWFVHAAAAPHVPLALQVCTPLPEH